MTPCRGRACPVSQSKRSSTGAPPLGAPVAPPCRPNGTWVDKINTGVNVNDEKVKNDNQCRRCSKKCEDTFAHIFMFTFFEERETAQSALGGARAQLRLLEQHSVRRRCRCQRRVHTARHSRNLRAPHTAARGRHLTAQHRVHRVRTDLEGASVRTCASKRFSALNSELAVKRPSRWRSEACAPTTWQDCGSVQDCSAEHAAVCAKHAARLSLKRIKTAWHTL